MSSPPSPPASIGWQPLECQAGHLLPSPSPLHPPQQPFGNGDHPRVLALPVLPFLDVLDRVRPDQPVLVELEDEQSAELLVRYRLFLLLHSPLPLLFLPRSFGAVSVGPDRSRGTV